MKRLISLLMSIMLLLSLTACGGTFAQVDLQDTMMIPENGIIEKKVIKEIKEENAIGSFEGESNGFTYEWTIFGSDISEVRDINLAIEIKEDADGVSVSFAEDEPFGFPALLSVYLNENWDGLCATAYQDEKPVYSVSLTGTKNTILNISVNDVLGKCIIRQDEMPGEIALEANAESDHKVENEDTPQRDNSYLSVSKNDEGQIYSTAPVANSEAAHKNTDGYLSASQSGDGRVYSDGSATEKDQYLTDPVPEGKPMPVEPENQEVNKGKSYTCTFSIECSTILNNLSDLDPDKREMVPSNGVILSTTTVTFYEGESVFDVLQRLCKEKGIHMESSWTPIYNSAYIEGIHNLYEFDCGNLSGWMYRVNGWYPNYGCSRYQLAQGDKVEWRYTCDLGNDVGRSGSW